MIGLYPTYFNLNPNDAPPAVPISSPFPVTDDLAGSYGVDPVGLIAPVGLISSAYPYSSYGDSYGSYASDDYL